MVYFFLFLCNVLTNHLSGVDQMLISTSSNFTLSSSSLIQKDEEDGGHCSGIQALLNFVA